MNGSKLMFERVEEVISVKLKLPVYPSESTCVQMC